MVAPSLAFLDASPLVPRIEFPAKPDCLVVFDAGSADRLGELGTNARAAKVVIVVDHHKSTTGEFGDILVVDPKAAASAQLTVALLDAIGWEIDSTVALCLLTGIVTDTGRFQYSVTSGEVLRVAARLLDPGYEPEVIGQAVYESVAFGYLQVAASVLGRAVLEPELGLVWSWVEDADLARAAVEPGDIDRLIDDVRVARSRGCRVAQTESSGMEGQPSVPRCG